MTTVFLIRHSVKFGKCNIDSFNASDDKDLKDDKTMLSVTGEKRAELLCNKKLFDDIDVIYASNMVRSQQTAKYLCERLNLKLNIDVRLNERRYGIQNCDDFEDWYERQYLYPEFKTIGGESQIDVSKRVHESLSEILKKHKNKKIAIFSHGYAITFAILKWCKLEGVTHDRKLTISYKDKIIMDKEINSPEVFKLEFDNDKLIDIELIEFDDLPFMHGGI